MAKKRLFGSKGPLIYATVVSLICVMSASISTFAWFALTYVNEIAYSSATIQTTDSNLDIEISTDYSGDTISGNPRQASGMNYWDVSFSGYLDDLSYNGHQNTPFYKLTWGGEGGVVNSTATGATSYGIGAGSSGHFYLIKVTFKNQSTSAPLYVYLGSKSKLNAASNTTANNNAALCERVVFRDASTAPNLGKNLCYWVPNRPSGAQMIDNATWTNATTAYGLAGYYKGAPEELDSPVNHNKISTWSLAPNVVHYGDFTDVTEGSTLCAAGQFICSVPAKVGNTVGSYSIYVVMWAEGTDAACTSAALSGATSLNLEFVALSKQLWPTAAS